MCNTKEITNVIIIIVIYSTTIYINQFSDIINELVQDIESTQRKRQIREF
jgi:hypothetical protein